MAAVTRSSSRHRRSRPLSQADPVAQLPSGSPPTRSPADRHRAAAAALCEAKAPSSLAGHAELCCPWHADAHAPRMVRRRARASARRSSTGAMTNDGAAGGGGGGLVPPEPVPADLQLQTADWVLIPQPPSVPVSPSNRSFTRSRHVPCLSLPSRRESWSFWDGSGRCRARRPGRRLLRPRRRRSFRRSYCRCCPARRGGEQAPRLCRQDGGAR